MMVEDCLEESVDAAQRATATWSAAREMITELSELRLAGDGGPVPAPGLARLVEALDAHQRQAAEAAELVAHLAGDPDLDEEAFERLSLAHVRSRVECSGVERTHRDLAQLALGISSMLSSGGRVERLDRMAIAALHPTVGRRVSLVDDGASIPPLVPDELQVVLGGLLCRMLVDHRVLLVLDEVSYWVDEGTTLRLGTEASVLDYESPVQVSIPARDGVVALERLRGTDAEGRIALREVAASRFPR
jgi:hypothetical protein